MPWCLVPKFQILTVQRSIKVASCLSCYKLEYKVKIHMYRYSLDYIVKIHMYMHSLGYILTQNSNNKEKKEQKHGWELQLSGYTLL